MKNVTITLDEELARWARVEAAKAGKSLSKWIGDRIGADRQATVDQTGKDWLAEPLWPSDPAPLPKRSELYELTYDRPGFRGYQHRGLHEGPGVSGEGERIDSVAENPPGKPRTRR